MIGWFLSFFPYYPESLEEFINFVEAKGCRQVTIEPLVVIDDLEFDWDLCGTPWDCGVIGDYSFHLQLTAWTRSGRKIVYSEQRFARFGVSIGSSDVRERSLAELELLWEGEQVAQRLREALLFTDVHLVGTRDTSPDIPMLVPA